MKGLLVLLLVLLLSGCAAKQTYKGISAGSEDNDKISSKLIKAIIQVESGGNPNAISSKGAIGLMQIMPATGHSMGYSKEQLKNPRLNVEAGTKYLTQIKDKYCAGDMKCAIIKYNCGPKRNLKPCRIYANKVLKIAKELGYEPNSTK